MIIPVQVIPYTGEQVVEAWGECVFNDLSSFTKKYIHEELELNFSNLSAFATTQISVINEKISRIHNGHILHSIEDPYIINQNDLGKMIFVGSETLSSNVVIIPNDTNSTIEDESMFLLGKYGITQVSISAESGVEYVGNTTLELSSQTCMLYKRGTNDWVSLGDYIVDLIELNS